MDQANCSTATLAPINITATTIGKSLEEAEQPVAIGIPTWPGLRRPTGTQLRNPTTSELETSRHAVVIVGYHADTSEILLRTPGAPRGATTDSLDSEPFIEDHVLAAWQLEPIRAATRQEATTT